LGGQRIAADLGKRGNFHLLVGLTNSVVVPQSLADEIGE
jgi:hypothetical protein